MALEEVRVGDFGESEGTADMQTSVDGRPLLEILKYLIGIKKLSQLTRRLHLVRVALSTRIAPCYHVFSTHSAREPS